VKEDHLPIELLARWLSGDLEHEELVRDVVPHFLAVCPTCRQTYDEILRLQRDFEHWDEKVAVIEGRQAPQLLEELAPHPFDTQLAMVRDEPRFQTWGLCQLLLRAAFEAGFEDPTRAVTLAELATEISELLVAEAYDPHWVVDLRAKCWANLGNARRILGELWSAETAFRRADDYLDISMTGNPATRAEVLHLKSSLRRSQRRLAEALELVDAAIALYRDLGDLHRVGRSQVKKAKVLEEMGDLEGALALLSEAQLLIDNARDPRLLLCARHNLVWLLTTAGRHAEAEALLPETRRVAEELGNPLDLVRLRWAEGRIAAGLGRRGPAEAAFREVQAEFFSREMGYDAALVSLDLAILYAEEGCIAELKQLAVEIMPVFASRDVDREALAALILFQHAAEEEGLTVKLARHLAAFLRRERRERG